MSTYNGYDPKLFANSRKATSVVKPTKDDIIETLKLFHEFYILIPEDIETTLSEFTSLSQLLVWREKYIRDNTIKSNTESQAGRRKLRQIKSANELFINRYLQDNDYGFYWNKEVFGISHTRTS